MGNATLSMLDTHGLESGNPNKERLGPLSSYFDDFCWTDEGKPHPAAMLFGPLSGLSTIFDGTIASGIQESATNAHFKAAQIAADPNSGPVEVGMSYAMQPLIALGHVNAQGGLLASQGPYYRLLPISPVVNKFPILHRPIPGTPNFPGIRIRPIIVQPGASATKGVRSASDVLMPGGQQVGRPGASSGIRRINGGLPEAQKMFDELTVGGKDVTPPGYPGKLVELPNGGRVGLRPVSSSADKSPSLDVNIPGIPVKKIHFEP